MRRQDEIKFLFPGKRPLKVTALFWKCKWFPLLVFKVFCPQMKSWKKKKLRSICCVYPEMKCVLQLYLQ